VLSPFADRPIPWHGGRTRLAVAAAVLTLAIGLEAAEAAFPGANGRIALTAEEWRPPDSCLPVPHGCEPVPVSTRVETVLPSGGGRRVLFAFPGQGLAAPSAPAWSPSGGQLAFQEGNRLAIMRHDRTRSRLLPQLTESDQQPAWSPDGRRLAFIGNRRCFGCSWLYTVRPDGTGLRRVIGQEAGYPAWSVTGRIAFVNNDNTSAGLKNGLYTIRPDGSRLRLLFGRRWGQIRQPDWSPEGSRIAFAARNHIFTVRADGRGLRRLTRGRNPRGPGSSDPAWSPDGKHIAFIRNGDLYVMRASGRGLRRIIDAPAQDLDHPDRAWIELSAPTWQPR
jgi:Tol biopolymer transport system component